MKADRKILSRRQMLNYLEDRRGAAAIVMAILTPVLIGGLAFGAEVGFWELEKRKLQNAVDTAAHAAGTQLRSGVTDDATLEAVAQAVAERAGYDGGNPNITLVQPPASGTYSGNNNALNVVITETIPRRFSAIYDSSPLTVNVDATALVSSGRPACVLALHRTASGAISTGGSTNVTLSNCDIATNSMSSSAATNTGNGNSVTASCISAVGSISVDPNYHLSCPSPISNAPLTADPYSFVPEPTCTSYAAANTFRNTVGTGPGTVFCWTGVGSINPSVVLTSNKTYVLHNSNVTINGNNRSISGTNVTLVLTGNSSIRLQGGGFINITAPTSGTYSGIGIFGSRASAIDMDFSGNSGARVIGAIYSPNSGSDITYTGSTVAYTAGQCTQVIGGTVRFWGNGQFTTNCSNSGTRPIMASQTIRLVE